MIINRNSQINKNSLVTVDENDDAREFTEPDTEKEEALQVGKKRRKIRVSLMASLENKHIELILTT